MNSLSAVILAGGRSSRMGGTNKCHIKLADKPLLEHVLDNLSAQASPVLINSNAVKDEFAAFDAPVRADTLEGFAGPLAGVLTGMRWAQENGSDWIITAAADTPFFPADYVERMLDVRGNAQIVLAASDSRKHPVFGLWDVSLADDLEAFLLGNDRKVMLFVEKFENTVAEFAFSQNDPFFNINTPDDLKTAESMINGTETHG